MIEVAAAVIRRADGAFLLARRPEGKVYAGWWEFPGGKVEAGEPAAAALTRELEEELGLTVRRAFPWLTRVHAYPHGTVRLSFFRVTQWDGAARPREAQSIRWQRLGEAMAEPMLPANAPVLAALALPDEYAVSAAATLGVEAMLERLERRLGEGLKLIQVREPGLEDAARAWFTTRVIELARRHGARVMVKAPFPGADGIHYTARELMVLESRPHGMLAAASCHSAAELARAEELGLDFAVLGPVRASPSHAQTALLGWEGFARLARGAGIPLYAIGGLRHEDLEDAWRAGAHGVAMISGSWG